MKQIKNATKEQLETITLLTLRFLHSKDLGNAQYEYECLSNLKSSLLGVGINKINFLEWERAQLAETHPALENPFNYNGNWIDKDS